MNVSAYNKYLDLFKNSSPHLIIYYSLLKNTEIEVSRFESIANEVFTSTIYSDINLTNPIGNRVLKAEILDTQNPVNIAKNEFPALADATLNLPEGCIIYNVNNSNLQYNAVIDGYVYPPISQYVSPIINGNGDFLNTSGFVVTTITDNGIRELLIYFFEK